MLTETESNLESNSSGGKENPLRAEKRRKMHELKEQGLDPFPHNFSPTHFSTDIAEKFQSFEEFCQLKFESLDES